MAKAGIIQVRPLTDSQRDCVSKLEEVLAEARAGKIHTVGIVCCYEHGFGSTIGGTNAVMINLGLDALKMQILQRTTGG